MSAFPRDDYLVQEVTSAPPQKLQLMLIEGALRKAQRAGQLWQAGQDEAAGEALLGSKEIVTELLCGLNPERDGQLVQRVARVYLFIFRALCEAHLRRSHEKLSDAVRLLEVERQTWQEVCQRLAAESDPSDGLCGGASVLEA